MKLEHASRVHHQAYVSGMRTERDEREGRGERARERAREARLQPCSPSPRVLPGFLLLHSSLLGPAFARTFSSRFRRRHTFCSCSTASSPACCRVACLCVLWLTSHHTCSSGKGTENQRIPWTQVQSKRGRKSGGHRIRWPALYHFHDIRVLLLLLCLSTL